jgi:hypothetical protein
MAGILQNPLQTFQAQSSYLTKILQISRDKDGVPNTRGGGDQGIRNVRMIVGSKFRRQTRHSGRYRQTRKKGQQPLDFTFFTGGQTGNGEKLIFSEDGNTPIKTTRFNIKQELRGERIPAKVID